MFLSVCSGIEAASVAWKPLGWKAVGFSEIEAFPSALLAHRYPDVPNHGDMTTLPKRILMGDVAAPELLCGGTPCQAFSVAGLRKSLDDARGNLSLVFCEIANAIDDVRCLDGDEPAIIFWENVPGVLNTKDNAFGCFLAGLAGEVEPLVAPGGKWANAGYVLGPQRAVAWRVLDAQYFGVAQRRRRVFVVASARDGFDPAAILFESEGVRRDTAPSRETGESVAPTIANGSSGDSGGTVNVECRPVLNWPPTVAPTLDAHFGNKWGLEDQHINSGAGLFTLGFHSNAQVDQMTFDPNTSSSLTCSQNAAVYIGGVDNENNGFEMNSVCGPLMKDSPTGGGRPLPAVATTMQVRRLTPTECERLQGFPDNYTLIPVKGKPAADGPRYKSLGNSWAVPNIRWIGRRIDLHLLGLL